MTRNAPEEPDIPEPKQSGADGPKDASRIAREICAPKFKRHNLVTYGAAGVDDAENADAFKAFGNRKPGRGGRKPVREYSSVGPNTAYCHKANWLRDRRALVQDACIFAPWANHGFPAHVRFNFKRMIASRAMCILANGLPPEGKPMAIHACGNGHLSCVNPAHLRWGSAKDNAKDAKLHHGEAQSAVAAPDAHLLPKIAAVETDTPADAIRAGRKRAKHGQ